LKHIARSSFAEEAEQKVEDLGYALELLLNDKFELFYAATTSDNGTHEFLTGIARNVPINDIFRSVRRVLRLRTGRSYFGNCFRTW
jgi:hypothetical protein